MRTRRVALVLGALLTLSRCLAAQDDFHGCGLQGTAKPAGIKAVNQLKNRYTPPGNADMDASVTLKRIEPGCHCKTLGYFRAIRLTT